MRYLILSDIHANLAALEAVLEDAPAFDQMWCIGDVVGYGPEPNECVEVLSEYDPVCVAGNHDWAALGKLEVDDFNPDARRALQWTQSQLSSATRVYLEQLPETARVESFTIVHGSPRQPIWEYVLHASVAAANFAYFNTRYCFVGHTHSPAIFGEHCSAEAPSALSLNVSYDGPLELQEGRLIINPGSVGQPRNNDPRASYIILDGDKKTVQYRRAPYPVEKTQMSMHRRGLPMRLAARLSYGW
jgi:predicted phosphodiesterase